MQNLDAQTLVFLERQFNDIKPLLPVANSLLGETHAEVKFAKQEFRRCSEIWDRLQRNDRYDAVRDFPDQDRGLLMKVLLLVMAFAVEANRVAEAAVKSQRLRKYDLLALLGQLREQVMAEQITAAVPAFAPISHSNPVPKGTGGYKGASGRCEELKAKLLAAIEHPTAGSLMHSSLRDIGHYAVPDKEKLVALKTQHKNYRRLLRTSSNRGHLARAYDLVKVMHALRIQQIDHMAQRSLVLVEKLQGIEIAAR